MRGSDFTIKSIAACCLGLLLLPSCRKDVDFDKTSSFVEGSLDGSGNFVKPWMDVTPSGITNVTKVEASTMHIYIAGIRQSVKTVMALTASGEVTPIFGTSNQNSSTGTITMLRFENPAIYAAVDGNFTSSLVEISSPTSYSGYSFFLSSGKKITEIDRVGNGLYVSGTFSVPVSSCPKSAFVERVDRITNNGLNMAGLYTQVNSIRFVNGDVYAVGKAITDDDVSIAVWSSGVWFPHIGLKNKLTDVEWYKDTLFIAGHLDGGKAVLKEKNGSQLVCSDISNTSSLETETDIHLQIYNGTLYAYGTVGDGSTTTYNICKYNNGKWSVIAKSSTAIDDITFFGGFIYAAIGGKLMKMTL